jgi:pimeloyl-ACP methyl ester carboxylesterase
MKKWFLLPGMGATSAMYDALRPEIEFEVNFLDWPAYRGEPTYRDVAKSVIGEYDISDGDIVGGASLGGMVALEIAKLIKPKAIVLLGSAINRREVQSMLSVLAPLAAAAPISLMQCIAGKQHSLVAKMFSQSDPEFIRNMCLYLPSWPGYSEPDEVLFRLHGRKDRIIPCPAAGVTVVEDAGHLLAITHSQKVAVFLNSI